MKSKSLKSLVIITFALIIMSTSSIYGMNQIYRGEIVSFFKDIYLTSNTVVNGSAVSFFGDITIDGEVRGDAVVIFGNVTVRGQITGDTVVIFGGIDVEEGGSINRDAISIFGSGINERGTIGRDSISVMGFIPSGIPPIGILVLILSVITIVTHTFSYIISIIALLFFRQRFDRMADNFNKEIGKKALIGILILVGGLVLSIILIMTIIGIPALLILIPALGLLQFTGTTTVKLAIGRKAASILNGRWNNILELTVGSIVYTLIDLTVIGRLFTLALRFIGVGEVVNSRFGEDRQPPLITSAIEGPQKGNGNDDK
ncbi:bactofilin family protein [Alkaliphilus serpentinus]|uniref:Polymer-forming cytoskeletal protein n=1 Tax=Alkaliphilus serpentinus TaxID=1482731 RepID=A0A833HQM5_9FIRM|nr:hypothetical protein [Alkaliphilus serpentinus]KAB3532073.1 hypothetical protein F8153_03115 [Alkaliphilus serpentinus]